MKSTLNYLTVLIIALSPSFALSAPKKADKGKCVACVTQEQRNRVQKKLDDLRAENARLRSDNEALQSRPTPNLVAPSQVSYAPVETVRAEPKRNRVSVVAGYGPSSLRNNRREAKTGNEISMDNSPVVGAQYQRLIGDTISVGAQITVPTVPDTKKPTYSGLLGFDF